MFCRVFGEELTYLIQDHDQRSFKRQADHKGQKYNEQNQNRGGKIILFFKSVDSTDHDIESGCGRRYNQKNCSEDDGIAQNQSSDQNDNSNDQTNDQHII